MRRIALLLAVAAPLAAAAPAAGAPRITVQPRAVPVAGTQVVKGRGWPVIEFCSRRVRFRLVSAQNRGPLGHVRVRRSGRFTSRWSPDTAGVGAPSRWRLVARMLCESGEDGSPNPVRATRRIRVRA